jgi:hypothetical protein
MSTTSVTPSFLDLSLDEISQLYPKTSEGTAASEDTAASDAQEFPLSVQELPFLYQSKQISQITAFIWRWLGQEEEDAAKASTAQQLLKYYHANLLKYTNPTNKEGQGESRKYDLSNLFAADPRRWLEEYLPRNIRYNLEPEAKLLIDVFGKERILNEKVYLCPTFTLVELGYEEKKQGNSIEVKRNEEAYAMYEFIIDPNSYNGHLSDPFIASENKYRYHIPFPACPALGTVNIAKEHLEDWIDNSSNNPPFPENVYLPATI